MAGFDNEVLFATNVDFRNVTPVVAQITTDGQLLIGATAAPNIRAGSLTSSDSSITVTPGAGTISLTVAGGTTVGKTITGNSGGAISPTAGNWNLLGSNTTTVVGSGSTLTITPTSAGYPITPYVVGPVGQAGYQTIQAAINAAHAAGGGTVVVQYGSYTENLTLFDQVDIRGVPWVDSSYVTINGQHTAPAAGTVQFEGITFTNATAIFTDNAAKNVTFNMINCLFNVTSGTSFNIPNFTGTMNLYDCVFVSTADSIFNNSSGSMIFETFDCALGVTTSSGTIQCNGNVLLDNSIMWTKFTMTAGTLFAGNGTTFHETLTFGGTSSGQLYTSQILSGSDAAITMSSSGNITIADCVINSSNNPAIAGSGAGTLTLGDITFISNKNISGTLTLAGASGFLAADLTAYAPVCGGTTNVAALQSASTGISTSGFVLTSTGAASLPTFQAVSASGAITTIDGDVGSVTPTAGVVTINGGTTGLTTSGAVSTLSLTGTLKLANGGTNANLTASNGGIFYSTATAGAILAGTATASQVLLSGASTTPAWSTATYPSTATGTGTILRADGTNWVATTATYPATTTINQLLYSSANNVVGGLTTANNGVLTTGTTGIPVITALASDGQLIIGSSAGAPAAATLSAGTGITIANGHNSITISASTSGFTWHDVTGGSATLAAENGYIADAGSLTTFTMPTNNSIGDSIKIVGKGAGGWTIVYGVLQNIIMGNKTSTTTTGNIASTNANDCVELVCTTASITAPIFTVVNSIGNISIT